MFKDGLLKSQRILVTGGGTGLGKEMATKFLELGAEVFICGRRKSVCDATAVELADKTGGQVTSYGVDIRNAAAVDEMIEDIFRSRSAHRPRQQRGRQFHLAHRGSVAEGVRRRRQHRDARHVLRDACGRQALDRRRAQGQRRVDHRDVGRTTQGRIVVPSAMSKAAVATMTRSLAVEWGRYGIRLNAIAPGVFPTEGAAQAAASRRGARRARQGRSIRWAASGRCRNCKILPRSCSRPAASGSMARPSRSMARNTSSPAGGFYDLREWGDEQWRAAREAIRAVNNKDRAARGA